MAQYWDILAKELQVDGNDLLDWQHFKETLIRSYETFNPKMVACNKLYLFLKKGMWKSTPMSFNICAPTLLSFLSPLHVVIRWKGDKVKHSTLIILYYEGGFTLGSRSKKLGGGGSKVPFNELHFHT